MAKKKVAKKAATKKTPTKPKRERKKRDRKKTGPYVPNRANIVFFMGQLILAGHIGKEIPEDGKEKRQAAMKIRQMAETLDRQTKKYDGGEEEAGED